MYGGGELLSQSLQYHEVAQNCISIINASKCIQNKHRKE